MAGRPQMSGDISQHIHWTRSEIPNEVRRPYAMLVVIWAVYGGGTFCPVWPIAGWGIGVAINGWTAYFEKPITEDEIRREMEGRP